MFLCFPNRKHADEQNMDFTQNKRCKIYLLAFPHFYSLNARKNCLKMKKDCL